MIALPIKHRDNFPFTLDLEFAVRGDFRFPSSITSKKSSNTRKGSEKIPQKHIRFPVVILVPGFLGFSTQKQFRVLSQTLVENGYGVCHFDFSSSQGKSDGHFVKGRISRWRQELRAVVEHVKKQAFTQEVILLGHSLGGMLSIMEESLASRLVLINTSFRVPYHLVARTHHVPRRNEQFTLPLWFLVDAILYARLPRLQSINKPVLIVQSIDDPLIPSEQAQHAASKIPASKLVFLESAEHTLRDDATLKQVGKEVTQWLARTSQLQNQDPGRLRSRTVQS